MKKIFEEEKKFDSRVEHDFFWKIVLNWVYLGQSEEFKFRRLERVSRCTRNLHTP